MIVYLGGVRNSAVASQPCPSCHTTTDKELCYASPKSPSATSFIRMMLSEIRLGIKRDCTTYITKRMLGTHPFKLG
ncbi:MAG: hypothetical protein GW779_04035 [Candidatus Altiarchaeum hamiconexum]|uniref:Uncharacterized protein n=1 Tax=Candidatus Altarchaeum hamiconexum TaxID=1803513 RepID=A0A8J8CJ28_9ARCH|nr:hypothetical protein [Candidatus Altarchaeum hamiconexum]NCS91565.1 hypothetical protein [Candidatus Altarchaeum hamiconexum]